MLMLKCGALDCTAKKAGSGTLRMRMQSRAVDHTPSTRNAIRLAAKG